MTDMALSSPPSPPRPVKVLTDRTLKRRSKSLDDLGPSPKAHGRPWMGMAMTDDRLCHYDKGRTPTSPVVSFAIDWPSALPPSAELPRRRHSSCIEPNTKECIRLATIYGWVTANTGVSYPHDRPRNLSRVHHAATVHHPPSAFLPADSAKTAPPKKQHQRRLRTSRSFSHSNSNSNGHGDSRPSSPPFQTDAVTFKFSKIFSRRQKSLLLDSSHSASFPNLSPRPVSPQQPPSPLTPGRRATEDVAIPQPTWPDTTRDILSRLIDTNSHPSDMKQSAEDCAEPALSPKDLDDGAQHAAPPLPPIESDPHIFNLLQNDTCRFIHYSKREGKQHTISSATVEKLVEKLTREMGRACYPHQATFLDSDFLMDFFLTFRTFMTSIKLCKLLILRFRWALMEDTDDHRLVRIRTFVVIRHWLTHYWEHDFVHSRTLRFMLSTFLSQLRSHPVILQSPRDERIIKNLRTVFKRQRKLYRGEENGSDGSPIDSLRMEGSLHPSWHPRRSTSNRSTLNGHSSVISSYANYASMGRPAKGLRKDSAVGIGHPPGHFKELRPSSSTPVLPFLPRARRMSSSSHRGVHFGNAWTAKMNFSIKTIKRSVPTMCQSIWQGLAPNESARRSRHLSCLCDTPTERDKLSVPRSLRQSTSRILAFESNKPPVPRASMSTPNRTRGSYFERESARQDSHHPNPLCPYHVIPQTPTPTPTPSPLHRPLHHIGQRSSISADSRMSYRSFILDLRSEILVRHFCIIEQHMLQQVAWDELVELRWRNRKHTQSPKPDHTDDNHDQGDDATDASSGGVGQLIRYFNMTCQWVASEVVQTGSLEARVLTIEKYIRIALKCYYYRNYSTLMQILLGLQSPAVSRLEKTWQRVDPYEMQIFSELKELAKPFRNWKNMRDAMNIAIQDIAESSAVESVLTKSKSDPNELACLQGCIPFLGLYLSDLVFNAELPTLMSAPPPTKSDSSIFHTNDAEAALRSRLSTCFVNYNKARITASVVKHVLAFQVLSRAYDFEVQPELCAQLRNLCFLNNADIRSASLLCEE